MRAVWLTEFGGPETLVGGDAPDPIPGPGQVVVDVAYAGVTFVETQYRRTGLGPFTLRPPAVPGNGVSGVVASIADDVDPTLLGARVVTSTGGRGGYAERALADASDLVVVPDGVALDAAVALLADGRTAQLNLRAVGPLTGRRVLVLAAAGGVGTLQVQLARAAGATVLGAAGLTPAKADLLADLGAEPVDYRRPDWTAALPPVDVVLDGVGGSVAARAFDLLRPGGRMLSYGLAAGTWADIAPDTAAARGVTLVKGSRPTAAEARDLVTAILAAAETGQVRPVIGQRFPLERAADAHAAIESRATIGKTVLEVR
ncbi:zinc-binding dehydrogenase [Saccharothrix hoggarensis]|uniref:Zinc-binding dehydrogenase n=1 Tax=Saccharothrix hoggarensis TaxID=913853 RepID=A0ABW3QRK5_9PSEU